MADNFHTRYIVSRVPYPDNWAPRQCNEVDPQSAGCDSPAVMLIQVHEENDLNAEVYGCCDSYECFVDKTGRLVAPYVFGGL